MMKKNGIRIGIFDSGVGGLNVLSCLLKRYPHNEYIFYGDTKNLPFGNKPKEELITLASNAIEFLLTKKVDIIIIACGTISSTCYKELKNKYTIPIYDIITPTIKYLKTCEFKNIGVIGTQRTIESKIFEVKNKSIIMHATPSFVPIIENNEVSAKRKEIIDELNILQNVDTIVLGCTHYPLLKEIIEKDMHVKTIDMGECLVNQLKLNEGNKSSIELYFTLMSVNLVSNINKILNDLKGNYQIYAI